MAIGTGTARDPEGESLITHAVTRSLALGIGLVLSAIGGVALTSTVGPTPIRASSVDPSSSVQLPRPTAARQVDDDGRDIPEDRPRIATAPTPTAPATESSAAPEAPAPTPEVVVANQLVPLAALTVDVWNAEERYFSVSGSTPDELMASARANVPADQAGADRSTMAYAGPTVWDHRPSYVQDPSTGSCTMTALVSNVAYLATLPQWTAPTSVPHELQAWWQVVMEHIRVHEGEHIRIFENYVAALPGRVVGQPCSAWDAIVGQWTAELMATQAGFDAAESHWPFPTYHGPLDW